jgi:hypothetical protein
MVADPMRSLSITVRLTPRQAVAALRSLEMAGVTEFDVRAFRAREQVMFGLQDAGWRWDDGEECWTRPGCPSVEDRS